MRAIGLFLGTMMLHGCNNAEMEAQNKSLSTRVADLEKEKARLEKENDALHAEVRKAREAAESGKKREALGALGLKDGQKLYARFETSKGNITCELYPSAAPLTVKNFVGLAEGTQPWTDPATGATTTRPLYSGTIFHRVIPEFMIQGGDPLGNGTGGPGYQFQDETTPELTFNKAPLLAMANAGPNTNGSQFFITDRSKPDHLNGKHTIFGACENADVVQAITTVERDRRDKPLTDVVLKKVVIERR